MNKYKEALFKLTKHIDFPDSPQRAFDPSKDEPRKYYIILQELVDKEKPVKVERVEFGIENEYYCPKCKCQPLTYFDYCPTCGQKLDWSDENV